MPSIIIPTFALPNGLLWTVRNTLKDGKPVDYNLVIASGFAAFCALLQLGMHLGFWFWSRQPPPTGIKEPFIKHEDGAGDGEHEDHDTDRDDVRSDGYEQDSEGSGQGHLGDPEDEHRVQVDSSSNEEVVDAAAKVAQQLQAVAGEVVLLPPAVAAKVAHAQPLPAAVAEVVQPLPAAAGEVIQIPPGIAAEFVQQPEVHYVPADAVV